MKGYLTIVSPNGARVTTPLTAAPTLEQLSTAVKGYIEVIPLFTTFNGVACVAFCNEEGKLNGLALNLVAQTLWERSVGRVILDDFLVGPIAIITGDTELLDAL